MCGIKKGSNSYVLLYFAMLRQFSLESIAGMLHTNFVDLHFEIKTCLGVRNLT